jgi:hypothetical protein
MESVARILRWVGIGWIVIGVAEAVMIVADRATSGSLGDDDLFGIILGLLADNALPGAVVLFVGTRLGKSAAKPDSMVNLIRQIAARRAAAKFAPGTTTPVSAPPTPAPTPSPTPRDARPPAEPVRSAAAPTVAARAGRKSVIER